MSARRQVRCPGYGLKGCRGFFSQRRRDQRSCGSDACKKHVQRYEDPAKRDNKRDRSRFLGEESGRLVASVEAFDSDGLGEIELMMLLANRVSELGVTHVPIGLFNELRRTMEDLMRHSGIKRVARRIDNASDNRTAEIGGPRLPAGSGKSVIGLREVDTLSDVGGGGIKETRMQNHKERRSGDAGKWLRDNDLNTEKGRKRDDAKQ